MAEWSTAELVALVGVSYSTLRRWVNAGHLAEPDKRSDGRTGVRLVWHARHVRRATTLAKRSRAGLPPA